MEPVDTHDVFNINLAKEITVNALVKEGFLTQKDANYFLDHYILIVTDKSWFGRQWHRLFKGKRQDVRYFDMVKFLDRIEENDDDGLSEAVDEVVSIAQLQFKLIQAEAKENFELAKKIREKIDRLQNS